MWTNQPALSTDDEGYERRHPEECRRNAKAGRSALVAEPFVGKEIGPPPCAILPQRDLGICHPGPAVSLHHPLIVDRHPHQQRAGDSERDGENAQLPRRPDFCDVAAGLMFTDTFGFG